MFDRAKQCNLTHKVLRRFDNFLYVFNLRQGSILIAIHQIALSSIVLIVLLVGVSHVGEMLSMLHSDMVDDAERRGFYEVLHGGRMTFQEHEPNVVSTINMVRFEKARDLANMTMLLLYTTSTVTTVYLMSSISLLYGAIKARRKYVLPWLIAACSGLALLIVAMVVGDGYPFVVELFGGHSLYHFACALFVISFAYSICAVSSFVLQPKQPSGCPLANDERGERLLLLDHAAHSSLLSAAQLSKLNNGTRTQFV